MKRTNLTRLLVVALFGALLAMSLGGCMAQNNTANTQQTENRQYMSKVNQSMEDLTNRLDSFNQAV